MKPTPPKGYRLMRANERTSNSLKDKYYFGGIWRITSLNGNLYTAEYMGSNVGIPHYARKKGTK